MRLLPVLLVLVLTATSPAISQVADDNLVVPGVRIGKWPLATSVPELLRMNGAPSPRPSIVAAFIPDAIWFSWDGFGLAAGSHDRRTIDFLALYDERGYAPPGGVGLRASRKAVLAAFGAPTFEEDLFVQGRIITILGYDKSGLAFFLYSDVVQVLLIFHPGALGDLVASC